MSPDTLIIADLHQPFTHRRYFDFARGIAKKYKTKRTVFIGDIIDNHAISYHEHSPNGWSPEKEMKKAIDGMQPWYDEFPDADWCIGNHDELPHRKGHSAGLPSRALKSLEQLYETPNGWRAAFSFNYGNWIAQHGTNSSGDDGAFKSMLHQGISVAQGHVHTASGTRFHANENRLLWALQVGWGGDRKQYAFSYGRDFKRKPILNVGLVLENGTLPLVVPMPM